MYALITVPKVIPLQPQTAFISKLQPKTFYSETNISNAKKNCVWNGILKFYITDITISIELQRQSLKTKYLGWGSSQPTALPFAML